MSKLQNRKTRAQFETLAGVFSAGQTRPVIVELLPTHMNLRLKGTRRTYSFDYGAAFMDAVRMQMEAQRRERRAAKKKGRVA